MNVAIIGAGVTGVTTAYQLAKHGCNVTVFERNSFAASETSFANGGQISVSQPFPWNSPDIPLKLLKWIGRKDAPLLFKLRADPFMWKWGLKFLAYANEKSYLANASKILKLALHSKEVFGEIQVEENLDFDHKSQGILKLFSSDASAREADTLSRWLNAQGIDQQLLDRTEIEAIEPALANSHAKLLGGTYTKLDESGNAYQFSKELEKKCIALGVEFHYATDILELTSEQNKICALKTAKNEQFSFDNIVICTGVHSRFLGQKLGINIPIYPVKGYSVSIPIGQSNSAPHVSITDMERHVVMSRLGDQLRAAGTAEINGYEVKPNKIREDMVLSSVSELFPDAGDFKNAQRWCGNRPMTSDGVPIIGPTKYKNLYLNTGHGHLGWTLSAGSAKLITEQILDIRTKLDIADYSVDRF